MPTPHLRITSTGVTFLPLTALGSFIVPGHPSLFIAVKVRNRLLSLEDRTILSHPVRYSMYWDWACNVPSYRHLLL